MWNDRKQKERPCVVDMFCCVYSRLRLQALSPHQVVAGHEPGSEDAAVPVDPARAPPGSCALGDAEQISFLEAQLVRVAAFERPRSRVDHIAVDETLVPGLLTSTSSSRAMSRVSFFSCSITSTLLWRSLLVTEDPLPQRLQTRTRCPQARVHGWASSPPTDAADYTCRTGREHRESVECGTHKTMRTLTRPARGRLTPPLWTPPTTLLSNFTNFTVTHSSKEWKYSIICHETSGSDQINQLDVIHPVCSIYYIIKMSKLIPWGVKIKQLDTSGLNSVHTFNVQLFCSRWRSNKPKWYKKGNNVVSVRACEQRVVRKIITWPNKVTRRSLHIPRAWMVRVFCHWCSNQDKEMWYEQRWKPGIRSQKMTDQLIVHPWVRLKQLHELDCDFVSLTWVGTTAINPGQNITTDLLLRNEEETNLWL